MKITSILVRISIMALFLGTFAPPSLHVTPPIPSHTLLAFRPVPLDPDTPGRQRLGALLYLGGWAIRSNDPRFGGISALHVEFNHITALNDKNTLILFTLPQTGGNVEADIHPLTGPLGAPDRRDTEAMAMAGDRAWLALEGQNAIRRYKRTGWQFEAEAFPSAMQAWPRNGGAEAMLRLGNGQFLVFSERQRAPDGTTRLLLFHGDPARAGTPVTALRYRAPYGYQITDVAMLPDGRMLLLHRHILLPYGFSAKLTIASLPSLLSDAVISGHEIATFTPPTIADNFEALAVTEERGRTIIWIASDDNFSGLQQNLLLKFALVD